MNWKILNKGMILLLKVLTVGLYFPIVWMVIIKNSTKILDYFLPYQNNNSILPLGILMAFTAAYIYNMAGKMD